MRGRGTQEVHRIAKSAFGCQRTGAARLPPPKVVAQRERWEVQPGAEGHQGRNWGPSFEIKREAMSSIYGSGREPQSCNPHPGPQRSSRKLRAGAAPPQPQGRRGLPTPHWSPLYSASGPPEPVRTEGERFLPLGSPPPHSVSDPKRGLQVGPGCRSLCLLGFHGRAAQGGDETDGRGRRAWRGPTPRVAQGWVPACPTNAPR